MRFTAPRAALATALAAGLLLAPSATAEVEPSDTRLFLSADGCGAEQGAGTLSVEQVEGTSDGCGTIGGLPLNEAVGATPETYSTGEEYKPITVSAGKVVGQVAADSWVGVVGGVGTVEVDVAMSGLTADDETVDLGSTTVSAPASPTTATVKIPFELAVPADADGAQVVAWSLSVALHGANVNANAQALDGDVFVKLPYTKP